MKIVSMLRCFLIGWFVLLPWISLAQEQILRAGSFELVATPVDSDGNAILLTIEQMPEYPGGEERLYAWLKSSLYYPADALNNDIEGKVITKFIIDTNGMVTDVSTFKSVYPSLDSVCFAAVKNMQPWSPAILEGKPVRTQFLLPVRFILTCDSNCVVYMNVLNNFYSNMVSESMVYLSNATCKKSTYSDYMGSLHFDSLLAGQYQVEIVHPDYQIFDTLIDIKRCTSDFTFYLKPLSDSAAYYWAHSEFNAGGAQRDIENNNMLVLLPGGLIQLTTTASDSLFEQKYHVRFLSQGCARRPDEDEQAYNHEVFNYLDQQYGRRWRREIRQDAIGLKQKK